MAAELAASYALRLSCMTWSIDLLSSFFSSSSPYSKSGSPILFSLASSAFARYKAAWSYSKAPARPATPPRPPNGLRPPPPSEGKPPRGPPISGKSLPDVGGGIALELLPNGLGPPSRSSTSLLGLARAP